MLFRSGNDNVYGGDGDDDVRGDGGNDNLFGGAGNDLISGSSGFDMITGGAGADVMNGGTGADTFIWNNAALDGSLDTIGDFSKVDILDFSGLGLAATDFIFTDGATGTTVSIATAALATDVVVLENVHGLNVNQMITDGLFIL